MDPYLYNSHETSKEKYIDTNLRVGSGEKRIRFERKGSTQRRSRARKQKMDIKRANEDNGGNKEINHRSIDKSIEKQSISIFEKLIACESNTI